MDTFGGVTEKSIPAAFIALLGTSGAAAAATCALPDVADKVDLKQVRGTNLMTVPVAINGTFQQFLLDLGTRPTKISQAAVAGLGLPKAARATENLFPKISFIGAGTVTASNIPVLIAANNVTGADKEKMPGSQAQSTDARIPDLVPGMDVLHHLHIYAVFGQNRLYVTQVFFS